MKIYCRMQAWKFIKADQFFPVYLPHLKSYKHKIRGFNGRGNPTDFSEHEKKEINKALENLFKDITDSPS